MTTAVATSAPEIEIRVKYIHPAGNKSGSFGILPESDGPTEAFRTRHRITTAWAYVTDPATGVNLKAFRPIEGRTLEHVRLRGIRDGQVCIVTQRAVPMAGRISWRFADIRPA
jgi:hypothetical protein